MSLTIINEVGSATANAYTSLATCGLYLEENVHISDTWAALSTTIRESCIIYATTLIDAQMDWIGSKADDSDTQKLRWPRASAYDADDYAIDDDIIPIPIQKGVSYYAFFLSQTDRTQDSDTFGFSRLDAGSLRMDIDKYDRKPTMPNIVWDLVKAYGTKAVSPARVLVRR